MGNPRPFKIMLSRLTPGRYVVMRLERHNLCLDYHKVTNVTFDSVAGAYRFLQQMVGSKRLTYPVLPYRH